ncbi:MAG TPA: NADH-quinone oxidoreductase subunit C [Dehalococcoidia bacterium]|nr:NADH-quinone oxidoreductase subunit C [Dehalococcoidia bacterium]
MSVVIHSRSLYQVAEFLKNTPGLDFDYLTNLAAVDYLDYFEVVYHLVSLKHNHSLVLKTRCYDRDKPVVPSVVSLWRAADFQEREAYDLMGIVFQGHPNLKRLLLWEGFVGHPLRRDYL